MSDRESLSGHADALALVRKWHEEQIADYVKLRSELSYGTLNDRSLLKLAGYKMCLDDLNDFLKENDA